MDEKDEARLVAALLRLVRAAEPAVNWGLGQPPSDCLTEELHFAINNAKDIATSLFNRSVADEWVVQDVGPKGPKEALIETRQWVIDTRTVLMRLQATVTTLTQRVKALEGEDVG